MSLEAIWKTLKENGIKYLVKSVAKVGGVKAWMLEKLLSRLLEEYVKPVVLWLERKGILWKKKIEIKKEVKELEDAKTPDAIDSAIDRIP